MNQNTGNNFKQNTLNFSESSVKQENKKVIIFLIIFQRLYSDIESANSSDFKREVPGIKRRKMNSGETQLSQPQQNVSEFIIDIDDTPNATPVKGTKMLDESDVQFIKG